MAHDEPGSRRRAIASQDIPHATFCVEDNFVGYANKVDQLAWNVAPGDAAATTIEEDELFIQMLDGAHPVNLAGGLAAASVGDRLWITESNEVLLEPDAAGTAEVQTITVDATGGNFTVKIDGETTANVSATAIAATLQTALEALSNVSPGDIVVTGGPGDSGGTTPYILTFGGQYVGNQPQVVVAGVSLTGGGSTVTAGTTTAGDAGDNVFPLGVIDSIDTARTPDVALVNMNNIAAFLAAEV